MNYSWVILKYCDYFSDIYQQLLKAVSPSQIVPFIVGPIQLIGNDVILLCILLKTDQLRNKSKTSVFI